MKVQAAQPPEIPAAVLRHQRLSEEQQQRRDEMSQCERDRSALLSQLTALDARLAEITRAYDPAQRVIHAASFAIGAGEMDAATRIMDGDEVATMNWLGPVGPTAAGDPA